MSEEEEIKCCYCKDGVRCESPAYFTVVDECSLNYSVNYWHVCKKHVGDFWEEGKCKLYEVGYEPNSRLDTGCTTGYFINSNDYLVESGDIVYLDTNINISKKKFIRIYDYYIKYVQDKEKLEDTGFINTDEIYESILFSFEVALEGCVGEDGLALFQDFVYKTKDDSFYVVNNIKTIEDLYDYIVKYNNCESE